MTTRRREFIDRLLRISELNEELLELGDKNRQPAYTKRIKLVQMGKAEFNLPTQPQQASLPKHNCKILVIDRPFNRYNSEKHNRSKTSEMVMTQTPQSSPKIHQQNSSKLSLFKRKTSQTLNEGANEYINFVVPIQHGTSASLGQRSKRPTSQYKIPRKVACSAKNILQTERQTDQSYLFSPKVNIGGMITGKSLKFHKANTMGLQKNSKIDEERRSKLQKMKEISKNYAGPFIPPPKISAKSYIICESKKSEGIRPIICYNSKNSQEVASLTKIMTCIVTIELCQNTKTSMDLEQIKIGKYQSSIGGTTAQLRPGQIYSVQQLLYGLMLPSGNDASLALAVWGGRKLLSIDLSQYPDPQPDLSPKKVAKSSCVVRFLQEMNRKAKCLGMTKTRYANSHGLVNVNNRSTAFDIALLTNYAMMNQTFRDIVSCKAYQSTIRVQASSDKKKINNFYQDHSDPEPDQYTDDLSEGSPKKSTKVFFSSKTLTVTEKMEIRWENTHKLLHSRPQQYIGVKTGITTAAGPCLSSVVAIDNRQFIIIVLGCAKVGLRFKQTQTLKKWLFKHEGLTSKIKKTSPSKHQKMTEEGGSDSEASWGNQED